MHLTEQKRPRTPTISFHLRFTGETSADPTCKETKSERLNTKFDEYSASAFQSVEGALCCTTQWCMQQAQLSLTNQQAECLNTETDQNKG